MVKKQFRLLHLFSAKINKTSLMMLCETLIYPELCIVTFSWHFTTNIMNHLKIWSRCLFLTWINYHFFEMNILTARWQCYISFFHQRAVHLAAFDLLKDVKQRWLQKCDLKKNISNFESSNPNCADKYGSKHQSCGGFLFNQCVKADKRNPSNDKISLFVET